MNLSIQAKDLLSPTEKSLNDIAALVTPIKPQLEVLRDLLQDGEQKVQDAQKNADKAEDEATTADKVGGFL